MRWVERDDSGHGLSTGQSESHLRAIILGGTKPKMALFKFSTKRKKNRKKKMFKFVTLPDAALRKGNFCAEKDEPAFPGKPFLIPL